MSAATTRCAPPASRSIPTTSPTRSAATVLAHENVAPADERAEEHRSEKPAPTAMWPTETFTSRFRSFYVNDDAVQVIRQIGAVSDGDVLVHFRRADVIATGDIVDLRRFPGSTPRRAAASRASSKRSIGCSISPCHPCRSSSSPVARCWSRTRPRVRLRRARATISDMVTTIKDIIEDMVKKGMSLEQVKSGEPDRRLPQAGMASTAVHRTTDMFVEAIYNGLKARSRQVRTE